MSREYILLRTYERKMAFSAIYSQNVRETASFFRRFCLFWAALKVYFAFVILSTTTPGPGTPPANSRHTKQFWSCPCGL
jgi:hypothetical protein